MFLLSLFVFSSCWISSDTHLLYIIHGPICAALLVGIFQIICFSCFFFFFLLTHLGILNSAVLWSVLPMQPLPFISSSSFLSVDSRSNRAPPLAGLLITCIRKSRSLLNCVRWHWLPSRC